MIRNYLALSSFWLQHLNYPQISTFKEGMRFLRLSEGDMELKWWRDLPSQLSILDEERVPLIFHLVLAVVGTDPCLEAVKISVALWVTCRSLCVWVSCMCVCDLPFSVCVGLFVTLLSDPFDCSLPVHGTFLGEKIGTGWHLLLQGIFLIQEWNPHLLHWQADPSPLCHQESPPVTILDHYWYSLLLEENMCALKEAHCWKKNSLVLLFPLLDSSKNLSLLIFIGDLLCHLCIHFHWFLDLLFVTDHP